MLRRGWVSTVAFLLAAACRTEPTEPKPAASATTSAWTSLSAGVFHTCAVTSAGTAFCWGDDQYGQLGDGATAWGSTMPEAVRGGITFASVNAGGLFSCGLTSAGAAYCWGGDGVGEVGDGTWFGSTLPRAVSGGLTLVMLSTGTWHSCGLTSAGTAYCWGGNTTGQLGDGTTTDRWVPVAVAGGLVFTSLSAGYEHTCGLTSGGTAYCWGRDSTGELGDGSSSGYRTLPVAVAGSLS